MVPTIGRIVHFNLGDGQKASAIVVDVHGPDVVSLCVFVNAAARSKAGMSGDTTVRTSVRRGDKAGEWDWPERA